MYVAGHLSQTNRRALLLERPTLLDCREFSLVFWGFSVDDLPLDDKGFDGEHERF